MAIFKSIYLLAFLLVHFYPFLTSASKACQQKQELKLSKEMTSLSSEARAQLSPGANIKIVKN